MRNVAEMVTYIHESIYQSLNVFYIYIYKTHLNFGILTHIYIYSWLSDALHEIEERVLAIVCTAAKALICELGQKPFFTDGLAANPLYGSSCMQ